MCHNNRWFSRLRRSLIIAINFPTLKDRDLRFAILDGPSSQLSGLAILLPGGASFIKVSRSSPCVLLEKSHESTSSLCFSSHPAASMSQSKTPLSILITATTSNPSISLSEPLKSPVLLFLTLYLANSDQPVTFITPDILSTSPTICGRGWGLIGSTTGETVPTRSSHLSRETCSSANSHDNLITMYPGYPIKRTVQIAHPGSTRNDVAEEAYLCETPPSKLEAGETYTVGLRHGSDYAHYVGWWAFGDRQAIMQAKVPWWRRCLGRTNFRAESMQGPKMIKVEIVRAAEISIEDIPEDWEVL